MHHNIKVKNAGRHSRTIRTACLLAFFLAFCLQTALCAEIHPSLQKTWTGKRVVWVTFKDKDTGTASLRSAAAAESQQWIKSRASKRRTLRGSISTPSNIRDLEVSPRYRSSLRAIGAKERIASRWFNAISVEATHGQVDAIAKLPFVANVEPARHSRRKPLPLPQESPKPSLRTSQTPSATAVIDYGSSFDQLNQIKAVQAHNVGLDGTGVIVGIMDTGFYKQHEALVTRNLIGEKDFVYNDNNVQQETAVSGAFEEDSHGTAVWSLIGGLKNGQMIGVAYNASFLLAKTEDIRSETPVEEDYWVAGLEWMEAQGADVVNSSLAYSTFDPPFDDHTYSDLDGLTIKTSIAADIAASLGVVVCNSMGNDGSAPATLNSPADAFSIISCGAVTSAGVVATFSSRGPTFDGRIKPEVCAMGTDNWIASEARPGTTYTNGSGTSFSSPLIAGAAALVIQAQPTWKPQDVRDALMNTASRRNSPDNNYGWGIIDIMAASQFSSAQNWTLYQ